MSTDLQPDNPGSEAGSRERNVACSDPAQPVNVQADAFLDPPELRFWHDGVYDKRAVLKSGVPSTTQRALPFSHPLD